MNRKGFTLIELLIVVVIIGILAAIAIPKFANTKQKAIVASMKSDLRNLVTAQEAFFSDNNDYAGNVINGNQVNGVAGAGKVSFVPSTGQRAGPDLRGRGRVEGHHDEPGGDQQPEELRYLHRPGGECAERGGDSGRRPGLLVRSRGTR